MLLPVAMNARLSIKAGVTGRSFYPIHRAEIKRNWKPIWHGAVRCQPGEPQDRLECGKDKKIGKLLKRIEKNIFL
jgi:hypothetical protein